MQDAMIVDTPDVTRAVFLFAHGAGAAMDSTFMSSVAAGLAEQGIRVMRFEFPYMQKRREDGKKRPPDRQPVLIESFLEATKSAKQSGLPLYIGGKSMGGRMATLLAADGQIVKDQAINGCICFGYPFHAPGKPMGNRTDHFAELTRPLLICQGTRDPFGGYEEFSGQSFPDHINIEWLQDGDHDLKPRKASGKTHEDNLHTAISRAARMMLNQNR